MYCYLTKLLFNYFHYPSIIRTYRKRRLKSTQITAISRVQLSKVVPKHKDNWTDQSTRSLRVRNSKVDTQTYRRMSGIFSLFRTHFFCRPVDTPHLKKKMEQRDTKVPTFPTLISEKDNNRNKRIG